MNRKAETSILSIRLRKVDRDRLVEEAKRSGVPLSQYAFNLICQGIEAATKRSDRKQKPAKEEPGEMRTDAGEAHRKPKALGVQDGPVDDSFLTDVKSRYPGLDHERLLVRLGNVSRETGKPVTRKTVEKLFAIAAGKAGKS